MGEYYVVRDKNTGLYFRGKGVNRWGKYYNQASIYRIRANAENTIKEVSWRGEQAEVVPIQIFENTTDVVEVVRCEKCKHFMEYNEDYVGKVEKADGDCYIRKMYSCDPQFCAVKSDDFCSYGTPKERGGE